MKLSITVSVETDPRKITRWLALEGAALLHEIETAIGDGDEVTIKLAVKKEVKVIRVGNQPPMVKFWEREAGNGH